MNNINFNNWLKNPHQISDIAYGELNAIIEKFPFFVPAQCMQMTYQYEKTKKFTDDMLTQRNRLDINPILWQSILIKAAITEAHQQKNNKVDVVVEEEEIKISPVFTEDYFQYNGEVVDTELPEKELEDDATLDEKALMVMMSFEDWMSFLKKKAEKQKSDAEDKAYLRSMWQRERLATAMEQEDDVIPEMVFEMAINSIDKNDIIVSEPLAELHVKQGRIDQAIATYKKLSLQNPEKKIYFADKIKQLSKVK
jgi:tetratricopeptide (TPR) repeat protein